MARRPTGAEPPVPRQRHSFSDNSVAFGCCDALTLLRLLALPFLQFRTLAISLFLVLTFRSSNSLLSRFDLLTAQCRLLSKELLPERLSLRLYFLELIFG